MERQQGNCVLFDHDNVGRGRTTGGKRAEATSIYEFVDPIIAHIKVVQKRKKYGGANIPVFLEGYSMGGHIFPFTLF